MADKRATPEFSSRITSVSVPSRDRDVKRTAAEIVAADLGWMIMVQQYPPGTRLREQELSGEFGVSRTVIRDVIGKLAARGFLEIHPWRGATVVSYSSEELADLLELNAMVYSMVSRYASKRRTDAQLARMDTILETMTELATSADTPEQFHVSRVEFYTVLNDATGSFFTGRRRANFPLTFYHQHVLVDALTPELRLKQVAFFRALKEHIQNGEGDAAAELTRHNFMEKRALVMQSLKPEAVA